MNDNMEFKECQQFRQWWVLLVLSGVNILVLYALYQELFLGEDLVGEVISNAGLIIALVTIILVNILFYMLRLETKINRKGILVRFFPFSSKFTLYPWEKINSAQVVKYRPLLDFGGWGYRISITGKGRALNVSGDEGLQLVFNNKDKLLIGTQQSEKMKNFLQQIDKIKI
jgi:hypothetical protein